MGSEAQFLACFGFISDMDDTIGAYVVPVELKMAKQISPDRSVEKSGNAADRTSTPEVVEIREPARNGIAEWAVTILLLLFGTTTLVQAFVIPTGSMEDTLLIGDHLLVDKLAYSPSGPISKYLLPYEQPKHGDIIVFRYPVDISQTFVKRVIGVPGDHLKMVNRIVYRNGLRLNEPYVYHKFPYEPTRDNFPGEAGYYTDQTLAGAIAEGHARQSRKGRRGDRAAQQVLRDGRQSRQLSRQPLLGLCTSRQHHR